jgi:hypothetical protein
MLFKTVDERLPWLTYHFEEIKQKLSILASFSFPSTAFDNYLCIEGLEWGQSLLSQPFS